MFVLAFMCAVLPSMAQEVGEWRIHPDGAKYKIEGDFNTVFLNGTVSYELTNVKPTGFSIPGKSKYYGGETRKGNVFFTFDHVTYNGRPDFEHIALWIYDEDLGKWRPDVETGQEENTQKNTNEMIVMLVLDCSSSLGKQGLEDVKRSAKSFLRVMAQSSNSGNIHIGIIGFSSMKETRIFNLCPLDNSSISRMEAFIDSFNQGNGTALYKSFDNAIDLIEEYANKLSKFAGAAVVTFTDGLDNGSVNYDKMIGNKNDYFKYIQNQVLDKRIKGVEYQSYTIFVPTGADVKEYAIQEKIKRELKIMAKQDGHFYSVTNTQGLNEQFTKIAQSLVNSWKVISCFISTGQNGHICWTFGQQQVKPVITTAPVVSKRYRPLLIGGNIGLGIPMGVDYYGDFGAGLDFQLGFDFAYPFTERFAFGAYFSIGGGFMGGSRYYYGEYLGDYYDEHLGDYYYEYLDGMFKFSIGLLMEIGDLDERPFIMGISPCLGFGLSGPIAFVPLEFRFGRAFRNNMYILGEATFGVPLGGRFYFEPTIRVGYNFGHNIRR